MIEGFIVGGIIGLGIGLIAGWTWGTTAENKLWLDALCGRERIIRGEKKRP